MILYSFQSPYLYYKFFSYVYINLGRKKKKKMFYTTRKITNERIRKRCVGMTFKKAKKKIANKVCILYVESAI